MRPYCDAVSHTIMGLVDYNTGPFGVVGVCVSCVLKFGTLVHTTIFIAGQFQLSHGIIEAHTGRMIFTSLLLCYSVSCWGPW